MRRSVKYGLYSAVLAGLVGATGAFVLGPDGTAVTVVVDGQSRKINTTASDVAGVLAGAGYEVGAHDLVAPSLSSKVKNGQEIVYKRGRLLHLNVDGQQKDVWTTASTVAEALKQLGYSSSDFVSVSRSKRLPLAATSIDLRQPKQVSVVHDGATDDTASTAPTVADLLRELNITVGEHDVLTPSADTALTGGLQVVIQRVGFRAETVREPVAFPVQRVDDPNRFQGDKAVVTPGVAGAADVVYHVLYIDGTAATRTEVSRTVVTPPTPQVEAVGTQPRPAPPAPAAVAPSAGGAIASPAEAQAIARGMLAGRGWGDDQFSCLAQLWGHESGWRVQAGNPTTGAYGIPQALPGSKMATVGPNWRTDAATQIQWGLGYIAGRYGTPCGAWSAFQSKGWY